MDGKIKELYEEIYDEIKIEENIKKTEKSKFNYNCKTDMVYYALKNKHKNSILCSIILIIIFLFIFLRIVYNVVNVENWEFEIKDSISIFVIFIAMAIACIYLFLGKTGDIKGLIESSSMYLFLEKYNYDIKKIEALIEINNNLNLYKVEKYDKTLYGIIASSYLWNAIFDYIVRTGDMKNGQSFILLKSFKFMYIIIIFGIAYYIFLILVVQKNEKNIIVSKFVKEVESLILLKKLELGKDFNINDLSELKDLTNSRNDGMKNKSSSCIKKNSNADYECENDSFKIYIIGRCKKMKHKYDNKICPICKKKSFKKNKKNWFS